MKNVCILRFDESKGIFRVYTSDACNFVVESLPRIGEKVVFDVEGIAHIAEVIDIHHNIMSGGTDIIIGDECLYTDYKSLMDATRTRPIKTLR